jgi:hypothetical protein
MNLRYPLDMCRFNFLWHCFTVIVTCLISKILEAGISVWCSKSVISLDICPNYSPNYSDMIYGCLCAVQQSIKQLNNDMER